MVTEGADHALSILLRVSVRWFILLAVAVAVACVIGALMVLCYDDGISVQKLKPEQRSDAEKTKLLKYLNSISGSMASVVMVPVQIVVAMYVAVATLCFTAK